MEPCSDSSEDEDLKRFQKKFMKAAKHLTPVYDDDDDDDDVDKYSNAEISKTRKPKNIDLKKNMLSKNSVNKSKHKRFEKSGDDISESEDGEDEEENGEDEMEKEMVLNRIKKSVFEDGGSDDDEDDESEEEVDPYASIRKELIDMSFEDKQRLRNKLGAKIYNQIVHSERKQKVKQGYSHDTEADFKDRPVEMSAKKRAPYLRKVVQIKRKMNRDPRFDDLSGDFKEDQFKHSYSFLEDMKKKEKETIESAMREEKDKERKAELKALANRYKQIEETKKRKEKKNLVLNKWKEKEKELVKQGKTPYFLKQSDMKKLELAEMYKELKSKGSLENYMAKKRKKNASKEKKKFHT